MDLCSPRDGCVGVGIGAIGSKRGEGFLVAVPWNCRAIGCGSIAEECSVRGDTVLVTGIARLEGRVSLDDERLDKVE